MKYAILRNNIVENIIVADQDFINKYYFDAINVDNVECGIKWVYDGTIFTKPVIVEPEIAEE